MLEPGIGTGLFPALMPEALRDVCHVTGVELDPVTARIARLLQPRARIVNGDFARTDLPPHFDLAIGNPPFSDRTVRCDRAFRSLGLRLHDYFIAQAIDLLKPGGLAAFVTTHGTMDKADAARASISPSLPIWSARSACPKAASAPTPAPTSWSTSCSSASAEARAGGDAWLDLDEVRAATEDEGAIRVNRWFAEHPDLVLGTHALASGPFGETYTCLPQAGADLARRWPPRSCSFRKPSMTASRKRSAPVDAEPGGRRSEAHDARSDPRGQLFHRPNGGLMQMVDGEPVTIKVRKRPHADGISDKHARIIRKLIPIRDAVREVLKGQETDQPWKQAQVRLRIAWSNFVRAFGPINTTVVSTTRTRRPARCARRIAGRTSRPSSTIPIAGWSPRSRTTTSRRNTARPGPIFTERVIAPPPAPVITSAADALAVVLNERGHVDPDHIAELLHGDADAVIAELGDAIFRDPDTGAWQTADAYLSGAVRAKLAAAERRGRARPGLRAQCRGARGASSRPTFGPPTSPRGSARPGFPPPMSSPSSRRRWMPTSRIHHMPELASWTVDARQLRGRPPAPPNGAPSAAMPASCSPTR